MNEEYERGYEDGFIDGVKKNSESRVSKFMEKHSEPVWVGLTDDDMKDTRTHNFNFIDGARWAEAKLKEKNGG